MVRHARASRCRIVFSEGEIEVADDGIGLADGDPWSTGLNGLRERVEAAGGDSRWDRAIWVGSRCVCPYLARRAAEIG